ncbi:MAG: RsmD family RNA methyltransferase [Nitrososphaerota archaeon]|nr:RsmD family RNA methyltransferase [Nitrososphaerota archaeon]
MKGRAPEKRAAAERVLLQMKNVKCVFEQKGGIEGELRLRKLVHLGGEDRTLTTHRENGCAFKVDVARCYFSPRLSTERLRIAEAVGGNERVLNMFAGVGPFSIEIAKERRARVTSCELNPYACRLHMENNRMNKVEGLVEVIQADAKRLPDLLDQGFDRILMPHPSASNRFLDAALRPLAEHGTIHYYRHVLARNETEAAAAVGGELEGLLGRGWKWGVRRVREVGPRWMEMAAEIRRD